MHNHKSQGHYPPTFRARGIYFDEGMLTDVNNVLIQRHVVNIMSYLAGNIYQISAKNMRKYII